MIVFFLLAIFLQNGLINADSKASSDWTTERTTSPDWWYSTTGYYTTTERYTPTTDWWYSTTDWWYSTTGYYTTTERHTPTTDWWYSTTDWWYSTTGYYTTTERYTPTTDWWYSTTDWWYSTTGYYTTKTTDWWYSTTGYYTTDWWYSTTERYTTTDNWWDTTTERYTPTTSRYTSQTTSRYTPTTSEPWYTTTSKPRHCPAGWIGIPGYNWCYKFVENAPTSLTWLEAEQICEGLGDINAGNPSWLATVDSESVHYFLSYVAEFESDFHSVEGWFLGLSDIASEGNWIWSDSGNPVYYGDTFWWPGYPDYSGQNTKDCGLMIKNYDQEFGWVDIPCDEPIFGIPICQIVL